MFLFPLHLLNVDYHVTHRISSSFFSYTSSLLIYHNLFGVCDQEITMDSPESDVVRFVFSFSFLSFILMQSSGVRKIKSLLLQGSDRPWENLENLEKQLTNS